MEELVQLIERGLLTNLILESRHPKEPVVVVKRPTPWEIVGTGNYEAVFAHPAYSDYVVKVYAPGRQGLWEETEVYKMLGKHPAYSECFHAGDSYLVLKRLRGVTLFNCLKKGIKIPKHVIEDIDNALDYARERGLHPHDVHGKNVMIADGRGVVLDVSDFLKQEDCAMWEDLKKAYYRYYVPVMLRRPFPLPYFMVDLIRKGYRKFRKKKS
ncbi:hypothetical protein D3C73_1050900 [compost metagenome]